MNATVNLSRRRFLKASAAAGGGLLIAVQYPSALRAATTAEGAPDFAPNAWIRINTDGVVTLIVDRSEMGQGVLTALPMLLAEELEVPWEQVGIEQAPAAPEYANAMLGMQATGGSTSVRAAWTPLRTAGATAREMLVAAAAEAWGVPVGECTARDGYVHHGTAGRRIGYGALATRAARQPVPEAVLLKDAEDFRLIGKPLARLDSPGKVDGSARFGIDVRLPGMRTAVLAQCPVLGGRLDHFDATAAERVAGVRQVLAIDDGVAVVADDFWSAKKGRDALEITWAEGAGVELSTRSVRDHLVDALKRPGASVRLDGDPAAALAGAARTLQAVYQVPFLAHATMEPMNCTAHLRPDGCDLWVGTQAQTFCQKTAAAASGLSAEQVRVHTTLLGGGFGRRFEQDFIRQAVQIAKAAGAPVKLVWTREDDMAHDQYRPATHNVLHAGLDAGGKPVAWRHRIAGPSIMSRVFPGMVKDGVDRTSIEGAANVPYAIPNVQVDYVLTDTGVPVGFWRSVGSSQNAFITECFFDEMAHAAGRDPLELRLALLADKPRHHRVLSVAAERAGWGTPPPEGRARGLAVHESFGSFVAEVAEISLERSGEVRVHRVWCSVDCGAVVNPSIVEAQMHSAIVYGLTAALYGRIDLENGRVVQSNFHDYPLLRFDRMPEIEVHLVASGEAPGGVGEPGTPPIAPAVANAVFALTGKRLRHLPIRPEDLRGS